MSITVRTEVFCDNCCNWIQGAVGGQKLVQVARRYAQRQGWTRQNGRDLCKLCSARFSEERRRSQEAAAPAIK